MDNDVDDNSVEAKVNRAYEYLETAFRMPREVLEEFLTRAGPEHFVLLSILGKNRDNAYPYKDDINAGLYGRKVVNLNTDFFARSQIVGVPVDEQTKRCKVYYVDFWGAGETTEIEDETLENPNFLSGLAHFLLESPNPYDIANLEDSLGFSRRLRDSVIKTVTDVYAQFITEILVHVAEIDLEDVHDLLSEKDSKTLYSEHIAARLKLLARHEDGAPEVLQNLLARINVSIRFFELLIEKERDRIPDLPGPQND